MGKTPKDVVCCGNLWEFMGIYGGLMGSNGIYPLVN